MPLKAKTIHSFIHFSVNEKKVRAGTPPCSPLGCPERSRGTCARRVTSRDPGSYAAEEMEKDIKAQCAELKTGA